MKSEMYLSEDENVELVMSYTGLSLDEIETVVGRFPEEHPRWPNKLKGELVFVNMEPRLVHHFTKKVLWRIDE